MQAIVIKRCLLSIPLVLISVFIAFAQGPTVQNLAQVKIIYIVPMKGGLDHYLTNELIQWGRFQVTLDPQQADALLSDTTKVDIRAIMTDPKSQRKALTTKGTVFLINPKTEQVIWSVYKNPSESFLLGGGKSNPELAHEMICALRKELSPHK